MPAQPALPFNHLLAALPRADLAALAPDLEPVAMRLGELLYEPGRPLRHAYFPTTGIVSLHYVTESGASAETAAVGHEGMVGVALFMGGHSTPGAAVAQTAGAACRIDRQRLRLAFNGSGGLRPVLLRYTQALITQIAQTAACFRHHTVKQQLARWLLATVERAPAGELVMTQELVAQLLGVRRESITQAAGWLQDGGYIRYRRGHISVVDADGLRSQACECHAVVCKELARLLPFAAGRVDGRTRPAPTA
jgi:CRP-like cAMP-binding protein